MDRDDSDSDSVNWGWSEYFSQLSGFFRELERQRGICSVTYAEYAVERLEYCETLINHLSGILASSENEAVGSTSRSVIMRYGEIFSTLQGLVQSLRVQWQQYYTTVECVSEISCYHPPLEHRQHGRPRFLIRQDQLEYL